MSLMSDPMSGDTGPDDRRPADAYFAGQRSFQFLPKELTVKCRKLIESYHGIYGRRNAKRRSSSATGRPDRARG
jgi:hypothetical protein